ncbi:MAG: hypothetical protein E3K29_06740 [Candidatus Brocadia sp.]|nr:hypothetical protein [Candidatus Brocadia sp.]
MEDRYTIRGMLEEKKEDLQALLTRMDNCVKDILYHLKLNDRAYLQQIDPVATHIARLQAMDKERRSITGQIKELEQKLKN